MKFTYIGIDSNITGFSLIFNSKEDYKSLSLEM